MQEYKDKDRIVLTCGDTSLYESDLHLLAHGNWLNDAVISLQLELLQPKLKLNTNNVNTNVVLLPPSMSFLISNCDVEDAKAIVESMDINLRPDCPLLLFSPLNDGNTHWVLLVLAISTSASTEEPIRKAVAYLLDSMGSSDRPRPFVSNFLHRFLRALPIDVDMDIDIDHVKCLKQDNSTDCGVFVLVWIRAFVSFLSKDIDIGQNFDSILVDMFRSVNESVDRSDMQEFRAKFKREIDEIAK